MLSNVVRRLYVIVFEYLLIAITYFTFICTIHNRTSFYIFINVNIGIKKEPTLYKSRLKVIIEFCPKARIADRLPLATLLFLLVQKF
nr:MAG TPA: hypothetical protein [Herelleviridae sp.]